MQEFMPAVVRNPWGTGRGSGTVKAAVEWVITRRVGSVGLALLHPVLSSIKSWFPLMQK